MKKTLNLTANISASLFHSSHENFLKQVDNYFKNREKTESTFSLSSDCQIYAFKKRKSIQDFNLRKEVLLACIFVNDIILHSDVIDEDFYRTI